MRRLTAWLRTREGEPSAKCGRQPQDTESDAEAMSDSSATLDSASLLSSSNAPTRSYFDPGRLSLSSGSHISRIRLESYSKPYDIGDLTIPFLDQLIVEMNSRFSSTQRKAVLGLSLVPAMMHELRDWKARAQELAEFYQADLPDPESFSVELHCWELKRNNHTGEKPKDPQQTLPFADCAIFQNIKELLKITCTLPVTSCECERSNSALKRLKTYLRSTMGHERLSGLTLLSVHYDTDIDSEHVLNHFARKNPRRMQLDLTSIS